MPRSFVALLEPLLHVRDILGLSSWSTWRGRRSGKMQNSPCGSTFSFGAYIVITTVLSLQSRRLNAVSKRNVTWYLAGNGTALERCRHVCSYPGVVKGHGVGVTGRKRRSVVLRPCYGGLCKNAVRKISTQEVEGSRNVHSIGIKDSSKEKKYTKNTWIKRAVPFIWQIHFLTKTVFPRGVSTAMPFLGIRGMGGSLEKGYTSRHNAL